MRKNKIKNYLKIGILLFGITLAFTSCITDDFQMNEEQSNNNKLIVNKINLESFINKNGKSKKLKLLSTKYDINKPHNKNNINSNDGSFTILTDEILEVSTDSITTTYTFRIETPTDTISTFENFMIEQKNDTLKFFLYKFKYDDTYPDFFPYETTIQNVDENQINAENFNEYLKDGYEIGGDGCLYYHTDAYFVHYSEAQAEYYGTDGFWIPSSNDLIFCPNPSSVDETIDAGDPSTGGGANTNGNTGNSNTGGGGGGANNNDNTNSNSDNDININDDPASFVVLPPKGQRSTKRRLLKLVNNPPIKSKIQEFISKIFEEKYENGYRFKYENETYIPREADEKWPNRVRYFPAFETKEIISLHFHPIVGEVFINGETNNIPTSPIFSDGDILTFLDQIDFIDSTNPELTDNVTSLLMTKAGLFALVVKDKGKANDAQTSLQNPDKKKKFKKDFEDEVLQDWENDEINDTELIDKFIDFLKNHKIDDKKMGIDIYQAERDGNNNITGWHKL